MKTQMRFQKILMLVTLIISAISIVYALCFCTPIYDLSSLTHAMPAYATGSNPINADWTYDTCQTVNVVLLWLSVVFLLLVAVLYITACNKRRNYYISNKVAIIATAAYAVILGVLIIVLTLICHISFNLDVWWDTYYEMAQSRPSIVYSDDVTTWILGYILGLIVIANAAALIYNLVWKAKLMKGERALLNGEPAKEVA